MLVPKTPTDAVQLAGLRWFPVVAVFLWLSYLTSWAQPRTDNGFFNGTNLAGWSTADRQFWSVQNGVIIGHADLPFKKNRFLWSSVKVADFYLSVDVKISPEDRNAGIQFRSRMADSTGKAIGYQADAGKDLGKNVWGKLYHELGRHQLDSTDQGEKAVKPGQWNKYEILAVGDRIWTAINGTLSVAIKDPGGEASGYIALQIHQGPPQTVAYRINKLVHNPKIELAGLNEAQLNRRLRQPLDKRQDNTSITFKLDDVIAFMGGTNISRMRQDGVLETLLLATHPMLKLHIWNLGWDGDTVYEQFRDVGFGSWSKNLDSLGATTVFVQFGQMEALQGLQSLPAFIAAYKKLLITIRTTNRQIILLSPIPFEPARLSQAPVESSTNPLSTSAIEPYTEAIKNLAKTEGYGFIDLYHPIASSAPFGRLTTDGVHLNAEGQQLVATIVMNELKSHRTFSAELVPLRHEILEKNFLWFTYWRPSNWAFLNGDRTTQPFSHDWKDKDRRIFPEEMKQLEPLIRAAEERIGKEQNKLSTSQ
jgi:hypothetical protein